MNIWVINQFAGTPQNGWGERHFFLSRNWLQNGHNVTIISGSFNHVFSSLPITNGTFTVQEFDGRRFCWVKTPRYHGQSKWRFWSMLVFTFKIFFAPIKKLGKPDVVIVSSMPIFPVVNAIFLRHFYGAKFIFEIRDLWPLSLIHLTGVKENHLAVKFIGWFEKLGYKQSDAIVSVLPASDTYINNISGNPLKFNWIPNGLDEECVVPEQAPNEILSQIPTNKFIIGYTGTFGLANALEYFIEAAKRLSFKENELHFVLVGDGYLKQKFIQSTEGYKNITILSKVGKNQVFSIIRRFDVCFIGWLNSPLYKYGVSANKYSDYMLCSKPILDSNNLIKDPVEMSGCGIIVEPESIDAIEEGIMKLFNMSASERLAMGRRGYEYVKKFNDMNTLSQRYQVLFNNEI